MVAIDWWVMIVTILGVLIYGGLRFYKAKSMERFYKTDKKDSWHTIGLSVMATQASAITFLSTPGQGYLDGLGFVQFYFGLPLALIFICVFFLPRFIASNVYTAYELLEKRLGLKMRLLTSILFLLQRGAAAGITILAPSFIVSLVLGWSLDATILVIGIIVIVYTVSGGSAAVNHTNKLQMMIMFSGLILALGIILYKLPDNIGFVDTLSIAGIGQKMNIINFNFDIQDRYNVWSGILGGFFLSLAYFGSDQSQVQRYLSGRNLKQARIGLIFNAIFKIPIQFLILFIGVLVFIFYQFNSSPLYFNQVQSKEILQSEYKTQWQDKEQELNQLFEKKHELLETYSMEDKALQEELYHAFEEEKRIRNEAKQIVAQALPEQKNNDTDFVFLTFILNYMPHGVIGLLIAIVFFASMSSSASEINALGTCSMIDFYTRLSKRKLTDKNSLLLSRGFNLLWGMLAILFAYFFSNAENLIQGVNIIGSLFYGNILGIFLINFFFKNIQGSSVFVGAIITQLIVFVLYFSNLEIGFLWYNFLACVGVVFLSFLFSKTLFVRKETSS